ncbi:MAG: metallophosphoesterase [Bacillota bacterium]
MAFLLIIATTFTFVTIFADMSFNIKGFEFRFSLEIFDQGLTEISIPPIGVISAKTHQTPLKLAITLTNIDIDLLQNLIEEPIEQEDLMEQIIMQIRKNVLIFISRVLLIASFGGAFAMLLLHKRNIMDYFKASLTGFTLLGVLFIGTFYTYNVDSFTNPQYRGVLKAAPWMISFAEQAIVKVDQLGEQLRVTADNLYELFEKVDIIGITGELDDTLKVLHISDIHNNPAAYDFVQQVTSSFDVDFIIDTGDISDFGSPLEAVLLDRITDFSVPYVFVAGNHDSPEIIKAMGKIKNVVLLNNQIINVKGLYLLGTHDPASISTDVTPPSEEIVNEFVGNLNILLEESEITPDILAVHYPPIAEAFIGRIPVILHGHRHRVTMKEENGSVIIDAGTTGAAGIRGLQSRNEVAYSLVLLHFIIADERPVLKAADIIKVFNLQGGFILQRSLFEQPE